jgi:hypothetical protein
MAGVATDRFMALVRAEVAMDRSLDLSNAMRIVSKRCPVLYQDYVRESTAAVKPSATVALSRGRAERPSDRVMSLARAEMEKDPTLDMSRAVKRVFKQEPALYEIYRRDAIG